MWWWLTAVARVSDVDCIYMQMRTEEYLRVREHTGIRIHTNIPSRCRLRGLDAATPQEREHLGPCHWVLLPFSSKRNQIPQQKWLAPRPGQGIFKMSLEHLEGFKSKKMLKKRPPLPHGWG